MKELKTGFTKDTLILMFDGTNKKIQNIKIGNLIMSHEYYACEVIGLDCAIKEIFKVELEDKSFFNVSKDHNFIVWEIETGDIRDVSFDHLIKNTKKYFLIKKKSKDSTISLWKFKILPKEERKKVYKINLKQNDKMILYESKVIIKTK